MRTITKINNKEIESAVNAMEYYDIKGFVKDCKRYVKAVKDQRLIMSIKKVSSNKISRTICVCEFAKSVTGGHCLNRFSCFLICLGHKLNKDGDVIIRGCNMDMVFALHMNICRFLLSLGVISEDEYEELYRIEINRV